MDGVRWKYPDKLGVLLLLGILVVFIPEVAADEDPAECFYLVRRISRTQMVVGSLICEFGCCGTVENRYCCTEEETYGAQWRAWRIAGIVVGSLFFITIVGIAVYCIIKKKNRKKMKINNAQAFNVGFSTLAPQYLPSAPPDYVQILPTGTGNWVPDGAKEKPKEFVNDGPSPSYSTALYD